MSKPQWAEGDDGDLTQAASNAIRDGIRERELKAFRAGIRRAAEIANDPKHLAPGNAVGVQIRIVKTLLTAAEQQEL